MSATVSSSTTDATHHSGNQHDPTSWLYYQKVLQTLPNSANASPHQSVPASPVYDDIRLLGALLGRVISKPRGANSIEGPDLLLLIENLRRAAKPSKDTLPKGERIKQALHDGLKAFSPAQHDECIRKVVGGFRLFLELATLAETYHAKHHQQHAASAPSLQFVAQWANAHNVPLTDAYSALAELELRFVSTAHPTQVYRETYLRHEQQIIQLLGNWHACHQDLARDEALCQLEDRIEKLWLTRFERWEKPAVLDEARGLMPYLNVILDTLPPFLDSLTATPEEKSVTQQLQLGSWIGGDMDGNPYTHADTLVTILEERRQWLLGHYDFKLREMAHHFSYSHFTAFALSPGFQQKLDNAFLAFCQLQSSPRTPSVVHPRTVNNIHHFHQREPIRQYLVLIAAKLQHTKALHWQQNVPAPSTSNLPQWVYQHPDQLIDDLEQVITELNNNHLNPISHQPLRQLIQRIRLFGFHGVGIDLREEAQLIQQALTDWVGGDAPGINDKDRQEWLYQHLTQTEAPEFSPPPCHIQPEQTSSHRLIGMLHAVAQARQVLSRQIGGYLLLSMTHHAHDVLAALLLCRWCQVDTSKSDTPVAIVPLFETIDDLRRAPDMLDELLSITLYASHIYYKQQHQRKQHVLMAYSDSNKDGGFLTSQWHLYCAQQNILKVAQQHQVQIQFYHGRGGSIGRGGGPTQRFIQSLPYGATQNGLQITEQGEVLTHHYLSPEMAAHHWQQYVVALLDRRFLTPTTQPSQSVWYQLMDTLSEKAMDTYVALKAMPGFIEYFENATPKEIATIHIGSRPSHRRAVKTIADLRAIPWVFRWYQSRTMLPGWYGMGSALAQCAQTQTGLNELKTMYQQWPYFKGLMDSSATTLLQADVDLINAYAQLAIDQDVADKTHSHQMACILQAILNEYQASVYWVQQITGATALLSHPDTEALRRSFEMKRPYLDPLNYLQIYLIHQYRTELYDDTRREILHRSLISSVGGVVAGLGVAG